MNQRDTVAAKAQKSARKAPARIAAARSCESFAAGEAPHSVRLWRAGWNRTDKGDVNFTPRSAALVMADYARRGNPLVFDYEHESLLPLDKRGGAPMKGVASATYAEPFCPLDAKGQPELWARNIDWTPEAKRQIGPAAERRQISPVCDFDTETGEVLNLKNVALCREGATHSGTLLASVAKGTTTMEELIQKLSDAANAGDLEGVKALLAQMVAMAKPAAPAAPAPPPAQHQPPPAAMAASRDLATGVFAVELAASRAETALALKEAKIGRVEGLIAASRDCFDAADEREHIEAADPVATKRHIESVRRKVTAGTIAASRTVDPRNPPKGGPAADETHGLNVTEIQAATNMKVSLAAYAESKARNEGKAS